MIGSISPTYIAFYKLYEKTGYLIFQKNVIY